MICDNSSTHKTPAIQRWLLVRNLRPFLWTKTADEILDTIASYCQRINDSPPYGVFLEVELALLAAGAQVWIRHAGLLASG